VYRKLGDNAESIKPSKDLLEVIRTLESRNVVRIYEHGMLADGRYYELMEFCEGRSLKGLIRQAITEDRLREMVRQLAEALHALHGKGVAHRDLKPANVLIRSLKPIDVALADFGISCFANSHPYRGAKQFTLLYASPSQLVGGVATSDDWWSLGVVVLEAMWREHPLAGCSNDIDDINYRHANLQIEVPARFGDEWKQLCNGLLEARATDRWGYQQVLDWIGSSTVGSGKQAANLTPPIAAGELAALLKRAKLFLEDEEFESADKYAERVLDKDPECGEAYLYKLMVQLKVKTVDELGKGVEALADNKMYQKALRFGSEELRRGLEMCHRRWMDEARRVEEESEQERQRLVAEAKAEAESATVSIASNNVKLLQNQLRQNRPFASGDRSRVGVFFVRWIPDGQFNMGSPTSEKGRSLGETQHEVVLSQGFFMAETECTQGQWKMVMGNNPSYRKGESLPVEQVSWNDAVEYCRKLTVKQKGMFPVGWEWRLPTEAEWEYAARAWEAGERHGELDTIAWWSGNSGSETHAVGGKQANALGLHDMMGNVLEWCSDRYVEYPTKSVTNPAGPSLGLFRVVRGGSWGGDARDVRSAIRFRFGPDFRNDDLGFRPVLSSVR
jgi:formylglycine-generating enzyme required for sulfatase activity